jgi:hypothetical protein
MTPPPRGQFASSFVVADSGVHGAIYLGTAGLFVGIGLISVLHFSTSHSVIARNIAEV